MLVRGPLIILLGFLSACQYDPVKTETSPYYTAPIGSQLVLNQTLKIPAHYASVYIQGGEIMTYGKVDHYYPNCELELSTVSEKPQQVVPDSFTIYKVVQDNQTVSQGPVKVAGLGLLMLASGGGGGGDGGSDLDEYSTIMYIRSDLQPEVLSLNCQHWEDQTDTGHLSIQQVKTTLGNIFDLRLAQ